MSDKKTEENGTTPAENSTDKELAELLDSALEDFSKEPTKKADSKKTSTTDDEKVEEITTAEQEWSDDFIKQAAEQFESNISALLGSSADGSNAMSSEQVQASLQRMAEAAQQALVNPGITDQVPNDFASTISQTIQGLSQGAENLQNPFSENDIMSMFGGAMDAQGQGGDQNSFLPFMQGMMQSLLSKEVLYPSLKDIIEKYPGWLQENDATLTPEDKERYLKQQHLMEQVCAELETESESDSPDQRKLRFDRVLGLMQSLQDYGQPPTDIVADVGPTMPFDASGNPEQCSIM